ncbi:LysR substrate-binding domain-containing protein [Actimicrobium sp. CCC2.4]|uniref:LysR substrate-binding domain-containing protein n=1 Tax=Actimicrobium sp. CCC2.4 TaxID=3048606 RepID=UPI002AC9E2FE|nr:LysR substrate-binding domain-containing protein [Actimicrobium sp. CCC2.4]MEB0135814.1 LysR substrate-binding domain-containing protein [Actimicrobium sp. CCC2.4]WPX33293.1 LysR substrate-binding domain-containing protein [Actimicrobium sp. CCC2.4]
MTIELRQLRYFVTVAEELHFGRAAARLHMTQPPLSQTIQALEAGLGHRLFARTNRSVALTPAGSALLTEARRLLAQAHALPELVRLAASGESGRLVLAFVSTADYSVLPPFLREFREHYPQVHIELREATTDIQLDDLAQNRIDVGLLIAPLPEKSATELAYLRVLSEPLILAAPRGIKALAGSTAVSLKAVAGLPLIIFPRRIAPAFHDAILATFRAAGLTPHIGQEAIQMQTIVGLVSAGMGIALVPQSVSNLKRPGVEYKTLRGKTPLVDTGLAWRRDNHSPVLHAFLDLLRKKT